MNGVELMILHLELRRNLVGWLAAGEPDQIFDQEAGFHRDYPTLALPVIELAAEHVPCMAAGGGGKVQRIRALATRQLDEDDLGRLFGAGQNVCARLNGASITGWKLVANGENPWPLRARVYVRLFQFGWPVPRSHQVPRVTVATFIWYER